MTVSSTTTRTLFNGNDVATSFPCTWRIFANTDIEVILRDSDGDETTKTLTTDYTVSIADDGTFTVNALFTPATGEKLLVRRNMGATQETDYEEGGAFQAESHENALDKVTMLIQQVTEALDRCVKLAKSSSYSLPELPDPEDGKALIWDGSDLKNLDLADVSALGVTTFWKAMLLLTTAAASRSALSVYSEDETIQQAALAAQVFG